MRRLVKYSRIVFCCFKLYPIGPIGPIPTYRAYVRMSARVYSILYIIHMCVSVCEWMSVWVNFCTCAWMCKCLCECFHATIKRGLKTYAADRPSWVTSDDKLIIAASLPPSGVRARGVLFAGARRSWARFARASRTRNIKAGCTLLQPHRSR